MNEYGAWPEHPDPIVPKLPPATSCALWSAIWREEEVFIAGRLRPVKTGQWTVALRYTCGQRYAFHVTSEALRVYGEESCLQEFNGRPCPAHRVEVQP